jgi:nitroreductase
MCSKATTITEAVSSRRSVRGFTDKPVDGDTIRRVLTTASRSPSGGNLQPWQIQVVGGEELKKFKEIMAHRLEEAPTGEEPEYAVYPRELVSPYRDYRFQVGEDMYGILGIPREDKAARRVWFARNYQCFSAPLALFCYVDRRMGPPQWSDLGMFLQTVMLLLREEDLDYCAQECWSLYPETLKKFLSPPEEQMLFTGMAIGYADPEEPVNELHSCRAPLEDFCQFRGI